MFAIRYTTWNRQDRLVTKQSPDFDSEEKLDRWIEKNEDRIVEVVSYSGS